MLLRHGIIVLLMLFLLAPTMAQDTVQTFFDIAYAAEGHELQRLDIFLPADSESALPMIFLVHGGGFVMGDKIEVRATALRYAEQGYVVVAPNYRLAPDVNFPLAHNDVFCAMAWTFAHAADYHIDLSQIVLIGESAGANIVAYLATVDDASDFIGDCDFAYPDNPDFQAAITFYLPVDLLTCGCDTARRMASFYTGISFFDWDDAESIALFQDISFITWLDANDPPFYMIHGANDFLVAVSESEFFVDVYQAVGGIVELVILEGANHGFLTSSVPSPHLDASYRLMDAWILDVLDIKVSAAN